MPHAPNAPTRRPTAPAIAPDDDVLIDDARPRVPGAFVVARTRAGPTVLPVEMADPDDVLGVVVAVHADR